MEEFNQVTKIKDSSPRLDNISHSVLKYLPIAAKQILVQIFN